MSGIRVEGNTSGNVAEVDNNNNVFVNTPTVINNAGYIVSVNEIDSGSITGSSTRRQPYVSRDNRETAGLDTGILDYFFSATSQDTGVWKYAFTTMTALQTGGFLVLNTASTATTTTGVTMSTWRAFGFESRGGLRVQVVAVLSTLPLANQIVECGLYVPTITTAPADGVYFRITSAGIIGVVNYNGTETTSGVLVASPATNTQTVFDIVLTVTGAEFWINGVLGGAILTPAGNGQPFLDLALPLTLTERNSGAVSGSPLMQFKVSSVHVTFTDMNLSMPLSHQAAGQGLTAQQGTAGGTMGSTEFYANNLAAGAGTAMTNTLASLGTGLGGQFGALPTFTSGSDGIVCSYQVPAGSVTAKPRTLMITGVKVMSLVTTALTGGPLWYVYSLAFGHTAVSMATAEGTSFTTNPTTKAPRRVVLGTELIGAGATGGTIGSPQGIYQAFNSPIAVNPGEFVAICAKNLGTVTTLGVVNFFVTYDAYWI